MTFGLLALVAVLLLAFARVPLGIALLAVSFLGIGSLNGFEVARTLVPMTLSEAVFSYELAVVPLFTPTLLAQGFDLVWFGIIVVVLTEIGLITPPIGMNVFVLKANLPNVTVGTIFRGLVPFIACDVLRLGLLVMVPSISLVMLQWMK